MNGQQRPVYRANGAAHAVRVPAGSSTVEFRYVSRAAVRGMVLSCLTGSGLAVLFGLRVPRRSLRIGALVAAALIAGAGWAWRQSLYSGHGFRDHLYLELGPAPTCGPFRAECDARRGRTLEPHSASSRASMSSATAVHEKSKAPLPSPVSGS